MKSLDKAVGAKLKQLRKAKGYKTQEIFAVALDTERANVARWEAGIFRPSPEMLGKILDTLQIQEEDLWPMGTPDPRYADLIQALPDASPFQLNMARVALGLDPIDESIDTSEEGAS